QKRKKTPNPDPANNKKSRPNRAAFLWEGGADLDLTGAPEGGHSPTQPGRKHSNPDPETKQSPPRNRTGFFIGTRQNKSTLHQPEQWPDPTQQNKTRETNHTQMANST
ncbi:hypothetical protein, partial [Roseibium album]|uniref:hypothetical protein n=1 Tax=Roseibium album TaxID=311410 RepID=UPI0024908462